MSELPYLKNKKKFAGGGSYEEERDSDRSSPEKLKDIVADELMDAFHKKDRHAFLHAIRALVSILKDED